MLRRLISVATSWLPARRSTDAEMREAEAAFELDEVPESVRLALSLVGTGEYCLGAGKWRGDGPPWTDCAHPGKHSHRHGLREIVYSDCSGFLSACWGIPRQLVDGTWLNTDELERIAKRQGLTWADARPGDGIVYGAGKAIGHCGLIVTCKDGRPSEVVHCSASGRHAVKREDMGLWRRKGALVVRHPFA